MPVWFVGQEEGSPLTNPDSGALGTPQEPSLEAREVAYPGALRQGGVACAAVEVEEDHEGSAIGPRINGQQVGRLEVHMIQTKFMSPAHGPSRTTCQRAQPLSIDRRSRAEDHSKVLCPCHVDSPQLEVPSGSTYGDGPHDDGVSNREPLIGQLATEPSLVERTPRAEEARPPETT